MFESFRVGLGGIIKRHDAKTLRRYLDTANAACCAFSASFFRMATQTWQTDPLRQ